MIVDAILRPDERVVDVSVTKRAFGEGSTVDMMAHVGKRWALQRFGTAKYGEDAEGRLI